MFIICWTPLFVRFELQYGILEHVKVHLGLQVHSFNNQVECTLSTLVWCGFKFMRSNASIDGVVATAEFNHCGGRSRVRMGFFCAANARCSNSHGNHQSRLRSFSRFDLTSLVTGFSLPPPSQQWTSHIPEKQHQRLPDQRRHRQLLLRQTDISWLPSKFSWCLSSSCGFHH